MNKQELHLFNQLELRVDELSKTSVFLSKKVLEQETNTAKMSLAYIELKDEFEKETEELRELLNLSSVKNVSLILRRQEDLMKTSREILKGQADINLWIMDLNERKTP